MGKIDQRSSRAERERQACKKRIEMSVYAWHVERKREEMKMKKKKTTVDGKQLKSVLKRDLKLKKKRYFHFNFHKLKALTLYPVQEVTKRASNFVVKPQWTLDPLFGSQGRL